MSKLLQEIQARNLIQDHSPEIEKALKKGTVFYIGADPTADSLHVGNLASLFVARLLKNKGLNPILIVGGGTARIGDPKPDSERPLMSEQEIDKNARKIARQVKRIVPGARVVNNQSWLGKLKLIEFLRDTGKHFTVNNLIKKEAIKARLDSDIGLSYTEFAYPLLQAYDFLQLYKKYNCQLQIGGSDQWGNIVAGIELIRKKLGKPAYGFTIPLLVDSTGKKFGKTEGNAIWLDPKKTSSFELYQFFLNQTDQMSQTLAYVFLIDESLSAIEKLIKQHQKNPKKRQLQKHIAHYMVSVLHGKSTADAVAEASEFLFYGKNPPTSKEAVKLLLDSAPSLRLTKTSISLKEAAQKLNLVSSGNELRRLTKEGAVKIAGVPAKDIEEEISKQSHGSIVKISIGKKKVGLIYFAR